jgi:hypothetical protein
MTRMTKMLVQARMKVNKNAKNEYILHTKDDKRASLSKIKLKFSKC